MILTKKPYVFDPIGDEDREDITAQYKFREGSTSERLALMNGVRYSERAKRYLVTPSFLMQLSKIVYKLSYRNDRSDSATMIVMRIGNLVLNQYKYLPTYNYIAESR